MNRDFVLAKHGESPSATSQLYVKKRLRALPWDPLPREGI
jgi:hypothetical protein